MTNRRKFLGKTIIAAALTPVLSIKGVQAQKGTGTEGMFLKVRPADDGISVASVRFKNHLNHIIAADLYLPRDMDFNVKHRAVIIGHPFGAVKEQASPTYGKEFAKRGILALAIDLSYGGESGGEPRLTVSPEAYVEDFSAAVDYLGTRPWIERNAIGVLGICGSGGFSVCATSLDPRIQALATVSMYDMGRATRQGLKDTLSTVARKHLLEQVAEQRYKEFEGGEPRIRFGTPEKLPPNASDIAREFYGFYRTERGFHPRYKGTRFTCIPALMNFYPFEMISDISPRPVLFIAGEKAHSLYFSEDAYQRAQEPKELYKVPDANHVDLYDQMNKIPFDKLEAFFKSNLPL